MVSESGDGRGSGTRRLVVDLSTAQLADTFLAAKARHCAPTTIRKYRWALLCLEREYPTLPRVTREIVRFVQTEPLGANSHRFLYETLRDFYTWIRANKDALAPELPHVWFGRRRVGEKRGRKREE